VVADCLHVSLKGSPVSYLTQNEIAANFAMQNRVAQAATSEALPQVPIDPNDAASETREMDADAWMIENRRGWAAAPGWDAAWESAEVSHPPDPEAPPGNGYDPGSDESVITDSMILSQVQAMLA
jgi:hypothetical protein